MLNLLKLPEVLIQGMQDESNCIFLVTALEYIHTKVMELKTQDNSKINACCPARMKVIQKESGECIVKFTKTHMGHLTLTASQHFSLASKIAEKISLDVVLDEVRDYLSDSTLNRLHLLTKKDLYNIEQAYNLQKDGVKHQDDGISVDVWVNEMKINNDSCVLFYKPQGIYSNETKLVK
ncbi:uncharacterized protein LOC111620977 [Centruroides sculpturatus]|uniref:uncharacterized protein LOC111620977 n=1 Tax=Centruroides sculpturatus TaxID=218467 RepID=UPI000C6D0CA2|nr:uncharacterized protein LOC111620977 [Centruroides sculpturatus]